MNKRRVALPTNPPNPPGAISGSESYLSDETKAMRQKQRYLEQQGHRKFASVNARDPALDEPVSGVEGELQNSILQHPYLDRQIYDGTDSNLNPEPPLNTDARREFDNKRREQKMEKQHRLNLDYMPKFNSTPKPPGY